MSFVRYTEPCIGYQVVCINYLDIMQLFQLIVQLKENKFCLMLERIMPIEHTIFPVLLRVPKKICCHKAFQNHRIENFEKKAIQ